MSAARLDVWRWRWRRLQAMSPAELGYRVGGVLRDGVARIGLRRRLRIAKANVIKPGLEWVRCPAVRSTVPYLERAEQLLRGELDVFHLRAVPVGHPPRWNRDPLTGIEAPLVAAATLSSRDRQRLGDIKYLWEPNRHIQLVWLAQAWRLSGDWRYLAGLRAQLSAWLDQCPPGMGPNWMSGLELAIRLINWSVIWQIVGGPQSPLFEGEVGGRLRQRWLDSIYAHVSFIRGHLSRHSSANNHLIGELTGIYLASVTWPYWSSTSQWRQGAWPALQREILAQSHEDGVNREQAVAYHQFVLDFALLACNAAQLSGDGVATAVSMRIEAMLGFLASMNAVSGTRPQIGDDDNAAVLRLGLRAHDRAGQATLRLGAELLGAKWLASPAGADAEAVEWLCVTPIAGHQPKAEQALPIPAFTHGGYFLLGRAFNQAQEIRLWMDAGPLGYRSIAAHGHADALAVTLSVGGLDVLIDPGTYTYHGAPRWRDWLRGTAAHNTVCVDELDQSESGGPFLWLRKARASVSVFRTNGLRQRIVAQHDGYTRLADPLMHEREVLFDADQRCFQIIDRLHCRGRHQAAWHWHFHPACTLAAQGNRLRVRRGAWRMALSFDHPQAQVQLLRAHDDPPAGWMSSAYGQRDPACTARFVLPVNGGGEFVTRIEISGPTP